MKKIRSPKQFAKYKRGLRVRRSVKRAELPRLTVIKSNNHIQCHIIDDEQGKTLCGVSTYSKEFKGTEFGKKSKASGAKLGEEIAKLAKKHKIEKVSFDRGPFKYHGVLAALAKAARSGGLQF